ncbi:MAG: hypothetical protein LBR80_13210 [Deltaproteobacteria bacterium]|nr:hypothetical protein [Deltaproteobacteria bacterium]
MCDIDDGLTETTIQRDLSSVDLPLQINGLGGIEPAPIIENHCRILNSLCMESEMDRPITPFTPMNLHTAFAENLHFAAGALQTERPDRSPILKWYTRSGLTAL